MFEKEIKFISDFSLNKLKSFGSFVTYKQISKTDLHSGIILYISAELDYMIFRDRQRLLEDSIFDYSGREIADHFNVIAEELKQTKKISISDIEKLITQAVSFNINYVVRPKWSLTKLIYNDQDFVSVEELKRMLNYLYYYDYVKNVLAAYISKRKVIQLTLTEFDLILNKIDRELFNSNAEELINNALHSIADFFNIGGIDKNRISLQAVEIFLKEKNLLDYLLKINKGIPDGSRKKYEIEDLKKVLYATTPIKPDSISGYDTVVGESEESESIDELMQEIDNIDKVEETDKGKEESSSEETEIVTEEKIKSRPESDEKTDDETDAENMIIDALETDVDVEHTEEAISKENEILEENAITEEMDSQSATKEEDAEASIKEKDVSEEDELLAFYEKELAGIEEDNADMPNVEDSQNLVTSTEDQSSQSLDENLPEQEEEEFEPDIMSEQEDEQEEIKDERTETPEEEAFAKKDFDLSLFDDEESETIVDEIIQRLSEFSDEETSRGTESSESTAEKEENNPVEKKIVEEMIEDYFKDESNKDEKKETKEDVSDKKSVAEDDNVFNTELASSILKGSSFEDDISSMINEIDEIIEQNSSERDTPVKNKEKKDVEESSVSDIEKTPVRKKSETEKEKLIKTPSTEKKVFDKKIKNPVPKSKVPKREKDLFSYLSRKEVKKIISNVFLGDEEDFVTTIEKISECASYKEGTEILKGVFFTYRVNPYSKEGIVLTNAVSHFFRQA